MSKERVQVWAPRDIMQELRLRYPKVSSSNLIRMMYQTSLLRAEIRLDKMDFTNKMGKFLYGKTWK